MTALAFIPHKDGALADDLTEVDYADFSSNADFEASLAEAYPDLTIFPVYFYLHGGLALDIAPIPNPHYGFDSGRAGVVLAKDEESARERLGAIADAYNGVEED